MSTFNDYYFDEHLLNHPQQAAIVKMSIPRLLVRFNYDEGYISDLEHFKEEINELSWLDYDVVQPDQNSKIIKECFDFLTEHRKAVLNLNEHA
ncbi:hypothetical protein [Agriterribacter sp.]|uniref:hypothetical protein n=1 Tax=Agriterribacter sp. TaxID=2821509 RepID=UPI002C85E1C4|nr:hypothetical protein [Agriterribacter sp.]HTN09224.1 hypothetical protein [Agriterribacter sp.]